MRGIPGLDDIYTLSVGNGDKALDVCVDSCVYTRSSPDTPGDEYCFRNMKSDGSVECQVGAGRYFGSLLSTRFLFSKTIFTDM